MRHRLALIGCGGMARSHAARFEPLRDRLEVTAVVDLEPDRAEAVAALLPNRPPACRTMAEALPHCDAVLLALPHQLHCAHTVAALAAGKHVLAEKPLGNSEEECRRMIRAAGAAKRVLMVAYCMRFHPLVRKLKELIDAQTYGRCFQLSIWTEQHTEREPENWMCRSATVGGGQLFSHGCHYIDLMLWMLGKPLHGTHLGSNLGTPWMEREGTSNVSIAFESGAMGYHFGTWGARGTRLGYAFHAHCEAGMLEIDYAAGRLNFYGKLAAHRPGDSGTQQTVTLLEAPGAKPTTEEMAHFLDCLETGAEPLTDPVSSLEGLQVIWKLYEAEERHELADLRGLGFGTLERDAI